MAKKEPKVARIVYQEGDPGKPKTIKENDRFLFEAWVPAGGDAPYCWSTVCVVSCCSREIQKPDAPRDYIHWEILKYIAEWSRLGYTIYYGKRETEYLDEREQEEWAKYEAKKERGRNG